MRLNLTASSKISVRESHAAGVEPDRAQRCRHSEFRQFRDSEPSLFKKPWGRPVQVAAEGSSDRPCSRNGMRSPASLRTTRQDHGHGGPVPVSTAPQGGACRYFCA
jgi:hypothetical protein